MFIKVTNKCPYCGTEFFGTGPINVATKYKDRMKLSGSVASEIMAHIKEVHHKEFRNEDVKNEYWIFVRGAGVVEEIEEGEQRVKIKSNSVGRHCPIEVCDWNIPGCEVESITYNDAINKIKDHMVSEHHFPEDLAREKATERVTEL